MSWAPGPGQGFTSAEKGWLPFAEDDGTHNVETESKNEQSVLSFYKKMLALRQNHEELTLGDFEPVPTKGALFCYRRSYQGKNLLVMINLSYKTIFLPKYLRRIAGEPILLEGDDGNPDRLLPYAIRIYALA
jgi:glycosidase